MRNSLFTALMCLFCMAQSRAALHRELPTETIIRGGEAGRGFTLLEFRRTYSATQGLERMVFEVGDEKGQRLQSKPGYYQVYVDSKRRRVVLDLAQMTASQVLPEQFKKMALRSPLVREARMIYDPEDRGLMMEFILKKNASAKVTELSGARLVLDIVDKNK